MTTMSNVVGAASHQDMSWLSIKWDKAHRMVRRLQVCIAKAVITVGSGQTGFIEA
jgi:hypothetical protein